MRLTVLICTFNRAHAILDCLRSVEQFLKNAAPIDAEILVVNNASTDDTAVTVRQWAAACAFPVNLVYEAKKGLAAARNCGLRNARGDLIVFTDDDCRLSETYITELLRYDTADGDQLVMRGGRVELGDPTDLPLTIKTDATARQWSLAQNSARHENLNMCFHGCNMTLRKALANKVGFFDERFGAGSLIPSAEDTDYIFRAYLMGAVLAYVPDMTIVHYHGRKQQTDALKLMKNYILGLGAVYAKYIFKHPNLCRSGYWNIKLAIKEIRTGKNLFMPEIGFSYRKLVAYMFLGALLYGKVCMIGKNQRATADIHHRTRLFNITQRLWDN